MYAFYFCQFKICSPFDAMHLSRRCSTVQSSFKIYRFWRVLVLLSFLFFDLALFTSVAVFSIKAALIIRDVELIIRWWNRAKNTRKPRRRGAVFHAFECGRVLRWRHPCASGSRHAKRHAARLPSSDRPCVVWRIVTAVHGRYMVYIESFQVSRHLCNSEADISTGAAFEDTFHPKKKSQRFKSNDYAESVWNSFRFRSQNERNVGRCVVMVENHLSDWLTAQRFFLLPFKTFSKQQGRNFGWSFIERTNSVGVSYITRVVGEFTKGSVRSNLEFAISQVFGSSKDSVLLLRDESACNMQEIREIGVCFSWTWMRR